MKAKNPLHQTPGSMTIGYARVSSSDNRQELGLAVQKEALEFCDKVYIEKESGGNQERPQLEQALALAKASAEKGLDTSLVVYKLDRLTRKMLHLSELIGDLTSHQVRLLSLQEEIETDTLTGKFFCLMLGYVAEWELQAISDRTKEGLRKARERGTRLGRPSLSEDRQWQIIQAYLQQEIPVRDLARQLQISTATLYSVLKRNNIRRMRKEFPKIVDKS